MRVSLFFRLGQGVYRFRFAIIAFWIALILGCTPFIASLMIPFQSTGFIASNSESALTNEYLDKHLSYNNNRFLIIYHSKTQSATEPVFMNKIKQSLSDLKNFPIQHEILLPDSNIKQISEDKHTAYVVVIFKGNTPLSPTLLTQFKNTIKAPTHMTMRLGGEAIFVEGVNKQTQRDLYKADLIAAPVSIIILVLVFGTIIAAVVPLCLGGGCALIILTTLYFIGHLFHLSIFTLNIALLLGLCLSLDYALFIINRFRDELRHNPDVALAIAITLATAGKAVFFSGLAVFISLSALLLFPINILFSVGVGGLAAVFVAASIAITLLPALLAVLKQGINRLPIHGIHSESKPDRWHVWSSIACAVVKRPILFFISVLTLLCLLGYPFLSARFGLSDFHILPEHSESRQFFETYQHQFNENELTPIVAVISTQHGSILSQRNINKLYNFTDKLKSNPLIQEINSIVSTKPRLEKSAYYSLYSAPHQPPGIQQLLKVSTGEHFTVMRIISKYHANASKTKTLIKELRLMHPGPGLSLKLTGIPVNNVDVLHSIARVFPYAIAWIMGLTYLILLILLRSIFLPLKAIIMNVLSLCASYGVLVFIFQDGHLHQLLHFSPQGMLDVSLLIIIFCALFGFSMDYEVFLLSRIQESYATSHDNEKSIIFGIVKSSRIITSAAIIVIFICGSFMVADVLMVKEFGLGIAVAIFVDAFLIRTFLVPATMTLISQWNWYLPKWLDKILPNGTKGPFQK